MYRLIKMELYKLCNKKSTLFLFLFISLSIILFVFFTRNEKIIINEKNNVIEKEEFEKVYGSNYDNYLYQLEQYDNKVDSEIKSKEIYLFENNYKLIPFIILVIVIISVSSITKEYDGSIKILVSKPYKRWKIIVSKIVSLIILVLSINIWFYVNSVFIINIVHDTCVLCGYSGKVPILFYTLIKTLIFFIPGIFGVSIGVLLSIIFKSHGLSIGFACAIFFFSGLIANIFYGFNIKIIESLFFPYVELSVYNNIYDVFETNVIFSLNLSIEKGILVLIIYSIIFTILSVYIFNKKDVLD